MELLELSLFVLFPAALVVFLAGAAYRVMRYVFLYSPGIYVKRRRAAGHKVKRLVETFVHPVVFNAKTKPLEFINGFLLMHILGLILLTFLLAQHIVYLEVIIPFYGVLWPLAIPLSPITGTLTVTSPVGGVKFVESIWGPLTVVLNGDMLTILALVGISYKSVHKAIEKARGAKHVRIGDVLVWPLLFAIVVTGWLAAHHVLDSVVDYRLILGLHIASAALFVAVWPFTKFFHFLWGYWYGKLHEWYDVVVKRGA